ncbi:hypothetical protein GE09DRAFT_1288046 [Coniochaeta sp. 2T2.1]|nr:hypothetical protein GE09DRAFT_1288046 [Coniochaeta sp. 2T2.1]
MLLIPSRRSPTWALGLLGCLLLFFVCGVSAAPRDEASTNDVAEPAADWLAAVPIAGFKPLYGEPVVLDKRQSTCSSNGSNFCFGDNVNFCATCGICCGSSASGYCCGADQLCCGTACCASGQTCNNGECFLPLETVIVTSAAVVTVSHVATQIVTVEQAVVSTSTIFSTTVVTVSNGETETDIVYVTVTAAPATKRAVVVKDLKRREEEGLWGTLNLFAKRFSFPWTSSVNARSAPIQRRAVRPTQAPLDAAASTTSITTSITQTSDVTSFVSQTTTVPTSSIVRTTVMQTRTRVVGATTTITTTSTLTVTPRPPQTETITKTLPPSNTPSDKPSNTDSTPGPSDSNNPPASGGSSGLSAGAKAGIGGGIGGAAALLIVIAMFWWYRRRRARGPPHQDPSSYLEPYIPDMSEPLPPPRTSPPNRFGAVAPHHDAPVANLDRYSNISGGPKKPLSPRLPADIAEAPGGEVYEADGTSRPPPAGAIYEADSGSPRLNHTQPNNNPLYPVDRNEMDDTGHIVSPLTAGGAGDGGLHQRSNSEGSSRYGSQAGGDLGFSPVDAPSHMGEGAERIRNTNPYRTPGAYRDF